MTDTVLSILHAISTSSSQTLQDILSSPVLRQEHIFAFFLYALLSQEPCLAFFPLYDYLVKQEFKNIYIYISHFVSCHDTHFHQIYHFVRL